MGKENPVSIWDFDGTFTDTTKNQEQFRDTYYTLLTNRLNIHPNEFQELMSISEAEILKQPGLYGWEHKGFIIAPSLSLSLLLKNSARLVIQHLRNDEFPSAQLPQLDGVDEILFEIHSLTDDQVDLGEFRQHAKECLTELYQAGGFIILTNSKTHEARRKLATLLDDTTIDPDDVKVVGSAMKHELDQNWMVETIPETTQFEGLQRPVYLRRKFYYEKLKEIGISSIDNVVGDIGELDLILPEAIGLRTILMLTGWTPPWEKEHWQNHPNGFASPSLLEITNEVLSS